MIVTGLRMSHFHGNNHNPLSPKQKTLTGFLHISDTTPSIVNSVHFNSSDIQIMGHETSSSTNESHDFQCELNDLLESNQLFVSNEGIVTSSENQAEYSNKEYQSKVMYCLIFSIMPQFYVYCRRLISYTV